MAVFSGEVGLQFTTHIANQYTVTQWVQLARLAHKHGFNQVWVNDNWGHRNVFVILSAIASRVPIKLGTAILVPYFRNPVDTADAFASLSEMMGGREISVGIARGDYAQAGHQIHRVKPISMVRETVQCLKGLLEGKTVYYRDYPVLSSFYRLQEKARIQLGFRPKSPILFYCGGNGPKILEVAGREMDGVLVGGFFIPLVKSGRLRGLLENADRAKKICDPNRKLKKVCEINVSVSRNYEKARIFPKRYIAHMLLVLQAMGFTDDEFAQLGIDPHGVSKVKDAFDEGKTIEKVAPMISDSMVDAGFIAGRPKDCVEKLHEMCDHAAKLGFAQVCLAKLGPNYQESIKILAREILPAVLQL